MKRYQYFIHTILVSVLMTSCLHYNEEQSVALSDAVTDITVSEARGFYENDIMSRADAESPKIKILSPGDYTPQWDNAEMSQNNRIACVDVPIIPTYRYRAIRSEFSRGQAKAYRVDVSQKLVIVKDRESGAMASYVMSLIPDKAFAAKHKGDISDLFLNADDRGKFSGIIVYTYHDTPIRLSKYVAGKKVEGISTCGVSDKQQYRKLLQKICHGLSGIKFGKTQNMFSRGVENDDEDEGFDNVDDDDNDESEPGQPDPEEPDPDPDPEEPKEPEEDPYEFPGLSNIGSGYYMDNDGNSYFDADGDGVPEREFNLEEDPHEFEESNHENNDTNSNEPDGGGGPQSESDGFYVAMGNNGLNKIYTDLCKKYLRVKKLKLCKGEYILQESWINEIDTIIQTYKSLPLDYYEGDNNEIIITFGEDVRDFWRDNGNYGHYWMRDKTVTVIVYCDENFSGDFIGTVSAQLDGTTIIVKKAIENTNVNGVGKFIVGLTVKE